MVAPSLPAGLPRPAPAAVLGLASALVDATRRKVRGRTCSTTSSRTRRSRCSAASPYALARWPTSQEGGYAVAVFAVFLLANALNFLMIAGHTRSLRGGSLLEMLRTVFVPVLPWRSPPPR